jgi:hypothetical protein
MSSRRRTRRGAIVASGRALGRRLVAALRLLYRALCPRRVPVEVLLTDRARRRALAREVRAALRQLRRLLGPALPSDLAVVVQQAIRSERPLAGCYEVGQRPGGQPFALVRLALSVDGRRLSTDEVLAVFADQAFALAGQHGGPREVVLFELPAAAPAPPERPAALRADPLLPQPDGRVAPPRRAA